MIRLQFWPQLEIVHICIAVTYRFFSGDEERGVQEPIWKPLVHKILEHLATSKLPLKANVTILRKFASSTVSPFDDADESGSTLREQIMPSHKTFVRLVQGLGKRAKEQAFTLQIYGASGSTNDDRKRLLQASYELVLSDRRDQAGSSSHRAQGTTSENIHFQLDSLAIGELRVPVATRPAPPPVSHFARHETAQEVIADEEGRFLRELARVNAAHARDASVELTDATDDEDVRLWYRMGDVPATAGDEVAEETDSDLENEDDAQEHIAGSPGIPGDGMTGERDGDKGHSHRRIDFTHLTRARSANYQEYLAAFRTEGPTVIFGGSPMDIDEEPVVEIVE